MKAWVQRVTEASVEIAGERVAEIGQGYLVLLGVTHADTEKAADEMAERICTLRIFEDEAGKTNRSLVDVGGSVIVVFVGGLFIGMRLTAQPDAVTNSMLQEKIDQDVTGLNQRLESMDSKLDILLNVATNAVNRDVRR